MLVAINYEAKSRGVKRGMSVYDALEVCPDMMFVHVATIFDGSSLKSENTGQKEEDKSEMEISIRESSISRIIKLSEDLRLPIR
jgi:nucleotidyltransferase/DNA polymerase involved in DNA repair